MIRERVKDAKNYVSAFVRLCPLWKDRASYQTKTPSARLQFFRNSFARARSHEALESRSNNSQRETRLCLVLYILSLPSKPQ